MVYFYRTMGPYCKVLTSRLVVEAPDPVLSPPADQSLGIYSTPPHAGIAGAKIRDRAHPAPAREGPVSTRHDSAKMSSKHVQEPTSWVHPYLSRCFLGSKLCSCIGVFSACVWRVGTAGVWPLKPNTVVVRCWRSHMPHSVVHHCTSLCCQIRRQHDRTVN